MAATELPRLQAETQVEDFAALLEAIAYLPRGALLFRGQYNARWDPLPNIYRTGFRKLDLAQAPEILLMEFKRGAVAYNVSLPNDWEWLAVAQHHGLLTPLLDWTTNPLVAAFFATVDPVPETEFRRKRSRLHSVVWVYRPEQDHSGLRDRYDPESSPFEIDRVVLFDPAHHTPRVPAQGGFFTVHPWKYRGIATNQWRGELWKILISPEARVRIRLALRQFGIDQASLFPGLDGLAAHVSSAISVPFDQDTVRKGAA